MKDELKCRSIGLSMRSRTHSRWKTIIAVWFALLLFESVPVEAQKLPLLYPQFKDWTRERAATAEVTIPYHPAAVQFYKEKGVWSARMDESQRKLLAVNP